jgi:hypothetical protein
MNLLTGAAINTRLQDVLFIFLFLVNHNIMRANAATQNLIQESIHRDRFQGKNNEQYEIERDV